MPVVRTINEIYKEQMQRMTKRVYPHIPDSSIENALNYSMNKRYRQVSATIDNNYTKRSTDIYLKDLTDYILAKEPICTGWGVLFKKHGTVPNPLGNMIKNFMDLRGVHKNMMFQYPKGTAEFAKYNMMQLLDKLDANATYGVLSNSSCLLYNLYVAASITAQGRELISTATMFFESFLTNGVKFASLDEILTFIDNVVSESDERKFKDNEILDRNITVEECFAKIVYSIGDFRYGKIKWVPDGTDLDTIWLTLNRLSQEDINRIYYKNNLVAFMENRSMVNAIIYILKKAKTPFLDPNEVPDDIKVEIETLQDMLAEYVYYHHQILDKVDRNTHMIKNVCCISDTDSAIVCLDGWYRFVLDLLGKNNVNMNDIEVSKTYVDAFSYYDGNDFTVKAFGSLKDIDYDFFNEDIIEISRSLKPFEVIPQDNLRYTIINIMSHIIGNLANDYLERFVKLAYADEPGKKCLIYLKNEFLFKRALLTDVKKHYATYQEIQEGNMIPKDEALDLKGLDIKKSTISKKASEEMQKIILEDILNCDKIDQIKVVKSLAILEKKIFQSIQSGSKDFYKPAAIKSLSSYDDPMRIQGVKAAYIWNEIRDTDLEAIDLSARNTVDIIKVDINIDNIEKIKETYPDTYEKIVTVLRNNDLMKFNKPGDSGRKTSGEISAIALPINVKPPKWLLEFVDYKQIINSNLANFPIESVGIYRGGKNSVNYTNIVRI